MNAESRRPSKRGPVLLATLPFLFAAACTVGCGSPAGDHRAPGARIGGPAATGLPEGPELTVTSNVAGPWRSGEPTDPTEIFAGTGIRFEWSAVPGPSGSPVTGYSYAVDDTSEWSPFSPNTVVWPAQSPGDPETFWFPDAGAHAFFVRAIDEEGAITLAEAQLVVFLGPLFCPPEERSILVVLDTDPDALIAQGIWPADYAAGERALVDEWFAGYAYQVFETHGTEPPPVSLLDCASSVFWIHSADVARGDGSVLRSYHTTPPIVVAAHASSGGNLCVAGLQPSEALRWFEVTGGDPAQQPYPVDFESTLSDPGFRPHWLAAQLGVARIEGTVGNPATGASEPPQLRVAVSQVTGGANPWPTLSFDPFPFPGTDPVFGYFDWGITPLAPGGAEIAYTLNRSGIPVGVRRLTAPGVNGNLVYLGFHPWFVKGSGFGELVRAVLTDFGELPGS